MVRLKTRWLLVRIVVSSDDTNDGRRHESPSSCTVVSKKELAKAVRESLELCFGVAASAASLDTQVRFLDTVTRLALLRVPREYCATIRAAVTFVTSIGTSTSPATTTTKTSSTTTTTTTPKQRQQRLVLSVLSVNGSARTAKREAIRHIRHFYSSRLNPTGGTTVETINSKAMARLRNAMDETLESLISIDY